MNEPIVKISDLSHQYSIQWAVRNINLTLDKNGIYGLLGPNGAGKSTTMNIMCGVLVQTHGTVLIKGIDMLKDPIAAKKHIGFLPQKPPLLGELTVSEFLHYSANLRLMPPHTIKKAIDEVMEKCALTHFKDRLISNLSGGYQQRVGIAQAIIHQPDFVVLDEPTNGLDPNQILEVRKLIQEIAEERTVVISTHILQEVQALCDHIWMINEGQMIFSGTLKEFDEHIIPNTLVVNLIATPSIDEIAQIPGIIQVDFLGGTRYRIQFEQAQEVTEQLVQTSVAKDWRLVEIQQEKNSLESIFALLTSKKAKR